MRHHSPGNDWQRAAATTEDWHAHKRQIARLVLFLSLLFQVSRTPRDWRISLGGPMARAMVCGRK